MHTPGVHRMCIVGAGTSTEATLRRKGVPAVRTAGCNALLDGAEASKAERKRANKSETERTRAILREARFTGRSENSQLVSRQVPDGEVDGLNCNLLQCYTTRERQFVTPRHFYTHTPPTPTTVRGTPLRRSRLV